MRLGFGTSGQTWVGASLLVLLGGWCCRSEPAAEASASTAAPAKEEVPAAAVPAEVAAVIEPAKEEPASRVRFLLIEIEGSLERSLVRATDRDLGPKLSQVTKRVLVWWVNPSREVYRGDRLEVLYEPRKAEEPIVHAVWYHSNKLDETRSAFRFQPEGSRFFRYFHEDGREVELRLVDSPIEDYEQVTSLLRDGRRHRGVDFKAPEGMPVRAPFDGRVARKNWSRRANGLCLDLAESRSSRHAYLLHLSSIEPGIRPGVRVKKGQVIGRSGNTGRSTAPHLHYQLDQRGRTLDPFRLHKTWRAKLPAGEMDRLNAEIAAFAQHRTGST